METVIWILHMFGAAALVGLVLLQHGKGADMGAAFGSGASGSLFGASGSANFLSRTTAALATVFFITSVALWFFSGQQHDQAAKPLAVPAQPVAPQPAPPVQQQGEADKSGAIPK